MENGERKKLSFTSPDEDHKEENSPYRLCSTFAVSLTQRSRHGGLGIEEEPRLCRPPRGPGAFEDCVNQFMLVLGNFWE